MTYKERSRQKHRKETIIKKVASIVGIIGGFALYIAGLFTVADHPRFSTAAIIIGVELIWKIGTDNDWFMEDAEEEEEDADAETANI